jgi:glucose/arabinose dehydrogenase
LRRALAVVLAIAAVAGCTQTPPPADEDLPPVGEAGPDEIGVVASDLDTPWEVALAPDGRLFFTERGGTIGVVEDGNTTIWLEMPETVEQGESGLMGLALHPEFPERSDLYVCQTHRDDEGELRNRIVLINVTEDGPGEQQVIVEGIDAGRIHDGCRLGFGPEGWLYVTMGDAADASRAQDQTVRNGKVLRYTPYGTPHGVTAGGWHPAVFTLGHRNPQGLAFHPDTGTPYVSEHGPENHDEVNVLREGDNYGWPEVRGEDDGGGRFTPAIWTSGEDDIIAPAGAAFVDQPDSELHRALVVAALADAQLQVFALNETDGQAEVTGEEVLFDERLGRLRAATWHDGALYLSTSNEDGRGTPGPTDDRILRIPLPVIEDG